MSNKLISAMKAVIKHTPLILVLCMSSPVVFSVERISPNPVPGHYPVTEKIAFLRLVDGFWQVWMMNTDGSMQEQLTTTPVDKVHIAWGPGSQQLLYHTNRGETWVLDLGTLKEEQILKEYKIIDAAWSPDGETLAYGLSSKNLARGKTALWISDLKGEQRSKLAGDQKSDALAPMWSQDGKQLVFRQCLMANNMQVYHDFWVGDTKGGGIRVIDGDHEMLKFDQAVSQQGMLAYSSARTGFYEIWTLPVKGGQRRQLTRFKQYAGNPAWSPDGKSIVFDSDKDGRQQIYRIKVNGKQFIALTQGKRPARKPVWSGDVPGQGEPQ